MFIQCHTIPITTQMVKLITTVYDKMIADHSGRAVCDLNCLRSLEHWDRGLESHFRNGCLCAFILPVLSCVQVAALRRADPPSKKSYRLCKRLRN
jgi:hypothetical protein